MSEVSGKHSAQNVLQGRFGRIANTVLERGQVNGGRLNQHMLVLEICRSVQIQNPGIPLDDYMSEIIEAANYLVANVGITSQLQTFPAADMCVHA